MSEKVITTKHLYVDTDNKVFVEGTVTKQCHISIGTRFYQNRGCVQIFYDPLIGYMVITPEAWDEINRLYTFRYWYDCKPFEKNKYYEVTGLIYPQKLDNDK